MKVVDEVSDDGTTTKPEANDSYRIVDLNYVSLYFKDLDRALAFYSTVFGEPEVVEQDPIIYGYRMGSTWLTLFPSAGGTSKESNPRNAEFAIQVTAPQEVDALYNALIAAGAVECMPVRDTVMYEPMRYGCVDDPFGVRIDVYCPAGGPPAQVDPPA